MKGKSGQMPQFPLHFGCTHSKFVGLQSENSFPCYFMDDAPEVKIELYRSIVILVDSCHRMNEMNAFDHLGIGVKFILIL